MHFLAESRKMISFLVTPTEKAIQYTVYVFYNVTSAGIISCQTSFRNVRKVVTASTYGLFVHYLYNFFHLYLYNLFICTYTICSYLLVLYNLFKCTCTICTNMLVPYAFPLFFFLLVSFVWHFFNMWWLIRDIKFRLYIYIYIWL